jgi:glycosyltransferase involved in cell wall biosynthesis
MTRLAILASHPVQYYAPLFRALAQRLDLTVFYAHDATVNDQAQAGFGVSFDWDVDLLVGYDHVFLSNVARVPGLGRFSGVDTPEIGQRLREGQFDAVLLMGWYLKSFIQGLVAVKRLGIPVMVRGDSHLQTPRGWLKVAAKRALYPHFLRLFDAALVVGKRNRIYWEHYGYPRAQMFDAPHCVDNAFFLNQATRDERSALRERLGISPATKLVLFAGKLVQFKRPLDVIEAVAQIRKKVADIEVLVAGSGKLEPELLRRAQDLHVPLHMLGFCNQTLMPAAYAAADVLVLPSDGRETWGLVVNEALASGKPALVSDAVGCAPDLAEILGSGSVFRLADIEDFAQKLGKLLFSPPSSKRIAAAASHFDLGFTADRIAAATTVLATKHAGLAAS